MTRITFILFLFIAQLCQAQGFSKFYLGSELLRPTGMIPTSDGGAFFSCKPNGTNEHVYVSKVDEFGNLEWSKKISQIGTGSETNGIQETPNGNYLISLAALYPNASNNGGGGTLVKLNSFGDTIWTRRYADNVTGTKYTEIILTSDNNYLLYWSGSSYEGALNAAKFSPNGNLIWSRSYKPNSSFYQLRIRDGSELADGSFVFSGDVALPPSGDAQLRGALMKLSANGNLTWSKYYNRKSFFESVYSFGNEIRVISRPHPSLGPLQMSYFKFDVNGINTANKSDYNYPFIQYIWDDKMSYSNQVDDSTYQITMMSEYVVGVRSLIVRESGASIPAFYRAMARTGGNFYSNDESNFVYGALYQDNIDGTQLIKSTLNSQPCASTYESLNFVNDTLFSETYLPLTNLGALTLIPSLVTINNNVFTSSYGCDYIVGLDEQLSSNFKLFPNPSSGKINIELEQETNYSIRVCNVLGAVVLESNGFITNEFIDLEHLSNGFYYLSIFNEEGTLANYKIQISH